MMASSRELAGATVADVLVQLRCEKCRQRPISVALVDDPACQAPGRMGAANGWRLIGPIDLFAHAGPPWAPDSPLPRKTAAGPDRRWRRLDVQDGRSTGANTSTTCRRAIIPTDREGRSCTYVPITENGRVADSVGFKIAKDEEA